MLPPTLKHKPSGRMPSFRPDPQILSNMQIVPEPTMKRKTLAERAGEPLRSIPSAPTTARPANSSLSNMAQAGPRVNNFSSSLSSASSRATSTASRTTSASSTRSMVGTTGRLGRPHTAMANTKTAQSTLNGASRPPSVNGDRETFAQDQPILGKRKGRTPSYISSATPGAPGSFQSFAQRQRQKSQAVTVTSDPFKTPVRHPPAIPAHNVDSYNQPLRELSLTSQFDKLTLVPEPTEKHDSMFDIESNQQSTKSTSTPSQIPRLVAPTPNPLDPPTLFRPASSPQLQSPSHVSKSPRQQVRSPSPQRQFLNKFSNVEAAPPAWDTKGRLEDMESLYFTLKSQMDSTTFERNGLEESVNLYKTRST